MKKQIHNIQSLRGIAAFFVLFYHMLLMEKKWGSGNIALPAFFSIGASGVDLFFIISGFIMVTVTRGMFQKRRDILKFLYNRVTRIYPLYWFYSGILLCVYLISPEVINPTMGNKINIIESFLLLPQRILPLLMVGWPLVHEMYFYIIFFCILLTPEKHLAKILLLWSVICISGYLIQGSTVFSKNPYLSLIFNPLTLEFITGCYLAILINHNRGKYGITALVSGIIILLFSCLYHHFYPSTPIFDHKMRIFFFGIPYSFILYGFVALEVDNGKLFSDVFKKIGDQSYSLYLSHTLIINGVGWIWTYLNLQGKNYHFLFIISMVAISLLTGYFSYRFLEIPLVKFTKKISAKLRL